MREVVLETDNGIIATALEIYADFIKNAGGNSQLLDRVNELSVIFRDKDSTEKYEIGVE